MGLSNITSLKKGDQKLTKYLTLFCEQCDWEWKEKDLGNVYCPMCGSNKMAVDYIKVIDWGRDE